MSIAAIATRCSLRRNSASHCCQSHTVLPLETTRRYAASSLSRNHPLPPARHYMIMQNRHQSTNFFSDEKSTAEQNIYFKKEDEYLLKNLLSNHPEYNPKYLAATSEGEVGALARDVHLVCKKHGIANVSLAFIHDIQTVFEMQGWKKPAAPVDDEEHKLMTSSLPTSRRVSFPPESFKPSTR